MKSLIITSLLCFAAAAASEKGKNADWLPDVVFDCDTTHPGQPANSVHELRPGDVDVIAAIGDSITAGCGAGAADFNEVFITNYGESWLSGGDAGSLTGPGRIVTLAKILQAYNPQLGGVSIGTTDPGLNVADAEKYEIRDLLMLTQRLVGRIQDAPGSWENDWKLINIFLGVFDLCRECEDEPGTLPGQFVQALQETLDYLHSDVNMPRAFINVILLGDITNTTDAATTDICEVAQALICPCAVDPEYKNQLKQLQVEVNNAIEGFINAGDYDGRDDFTVVVQPFFKNLKPAVDENGDIITEFFSHDCFHPSRAAHHVYTQMLWESMLSPFHQKPDYEDITEDDLVELANLKCTDETAPFFFTRQNSFSDRH